MPPPRPAARCCRAVQQQLRAPLDNVWITDALLSSAFERYCHVSCLTRRQSSSLPGPMESRRRLGRRRMTDLHMESHSTLPPWVIEFPLEWSQLKWQPPTVRLSGEERDLQAGRDQSVLSWVLKSWIPNGRTGETRPEVEGAERAGDETTTSTGALLEKLSQVQVAVAASLPDAIEPAYHNFIGSLQQELKLGIWDTDAVEMAVSTFPPSLIDAVGDQKAANAASEMFLSAVVNGISSSTVLGPSEFDGKFWNLLLKQISQLQSTHSTAILLQTTLDAVPPGCVNDVHEGLVAAVQTLVVHGSTGPRRAADIGVALRELSSDDHGALLRDMEAAVYEGLAGYKETGRRKLRFLWLQVLAHMPRVRQNYVFDACVRSAYFDREVPGPVGRDLGQLLIQQWTSRGYLERHRAVEGCWKRDSAGRDDLRLAALAINIGNLQQSNSVGLLMSLLEALRRIGRQEELMAELRVFCQGKRQLRIMPFKQLAMAVCDHRIALELLSLLDNALQVDAKIGFRWDWTAWTPYVEAMIKDDSVAAATVWRVVNSGATRIGVAPEQKELLLKRRTRLLENMAVWFSQAEHLTDRAALHNVSRCVGWLQGHNVKLSRRALLAVVSVTTREFKRMEFGRTRRIGWMLNLLERYQGSEERKAVAQVLRRWRARNGDLRRQVTNEV